ncbi:MAG: glycerol-3-phosphate 1-O-acyltransferase PlsY [Campylobacteraceae bacterium]
MPEVFLNFITDPKVLFYIATYFVGGIPFGLLLAKYYANVDIKEAGSKSIGATNVLRVVKEKDPKLAKKLAIATVALDALKGVVMLLIAMLLGFSQSALWLVAILALVGHCFSPYLNFEGGKGIATGAGVLLVLLPIETVIAAVVWFVSGKIFKISSVASLLALTSLVVSSFIIHPQMPEVYSHTPLIIICIIIVYKHIPNIVRLLKKEEKKVV